MELMKNSLMNIQFRKPVWQHSLVTLMQLGQLKNVVEVTQVFLQCFYCLCACKKVLSKNQFCLSVCSF